MNERLSPHYAPNSWSSLNTRSRRAELLSFDRRNCVGRNATGERGSIGGGGGGRPGALIGGPGLDSCGGRGCAMDRDTLTPEHIAVLYLKVLNSFSQR